MRDSRLANGQVRKRAATEPGGSFPGGVGDRDGRAWALLGEFGHRHPLASGEPVAQEDRDLHTVGPITVDSDVLTLPGADLRVVMYTAAPGSADVSTLDLLRVSGIHTVTS